MRKGDLKSRVCDIGWYTNRRESFWGEAKEKGP